MSPKDVVAKDPTGVLPKAAADRDGYISFRNRWQDANDIQVGLLNPVRRSGGWSQNEYLNLRLMAMDTRFFGGPGKDRGVENYSTLLVDGSNAGKAATFVPGKTAAFEPAPNGGYAIVDAGDCYKALGVSQARRHLLVAFSDPKDNGAILSTLDDIASDTEHTYTWQANLGPEGRVAPEGAAPGGRQPVKPDADASTDALDSLKGEPSKPKAPSKEEAMAQLKPCDDDIKSAAGREAGRPCFLLTGRQGFVKGWVVHPAEAKITAGDPLRIETKGAAAKIWVVMQVGKGKAPEAAVTGEGMGSVIRIGGTGVAWDAGKGRLTARPFGAHGEASK